MHKLEAAYLLGLEPYSFRWAWESAKVLGPQWITTEGIADESFANLKTPILNLRDALKALEQDVDGSVSDSLSQIDKLASSADELWTRVENGEGVAEWECPRETISLVTGLRELLVIKPNLFQWLELGGAVGMCLDCAIARTEVTQVESNIAALRKRIHELLNIPDALGAASDNIAGSTAPGPQVVAALERIEVVGREDTMLEHAMELQLAILKLDSSIRKCIATITEPVAAVGRSEMQKTLHVQQDAAGEAGQDDALEQAQNVSEVPADTKEWLRVTDAAGKAQVKPGSISRACSCHRLKYNGKKGPERRIDPQSLVEWMEKRECKAATEKPNSDTSRRLSTKVDIWWRCSDADCGYSDRDIDDKCPKCGHPMIGPIVRRLRLKNGAGGGRTM